MRTLSPTHRAGVRPESPVVQQTLQVNHSINKSNSSLQWGTLNALGATILGYDLSLTCARYRTYIYQIEFALVVILSLNTLYHFCRYFYNRIYRHPVAVTAGQKKLLGFKDNDPHYKLVNTSTPTKESQPATPNSSSLNSTTLSWRSQSPQNDSIYSVPSPSWVYYQGTPDQVHQDSPVKTPIPDTSGVDFISDQKSLSQYLRDYESHEKTLNVSSNNEEPSNLLTSFWSHPASRACNEVSVFLKNSTYQIASQAIEKLSGSPGSGHSDSNNSPISLQNQRMEIWNKLKVTSEMLIMWHASLRMWINQTVLDRLVSEINSVNEALHRHGFSDVQIGAVGLERLRKTAQTQQGQQYVPTLTSLIPFLEASSNQEYLVKRIKELSKGGSMSEYRWNTGGSFNGKNWEDHLPTDAAVIMHLVATYLDTQLVPLPQQPDARPFTARHILKGTDKPGPNAASVIIKEVTEKPPYYNLIVERQTQDVAKGRNNLFHVLLLFLYQQNLIEHGMIGRVNLGKSGVNMLWIIGK